MEVMNDLGLNSDKDRIIAKMQLLGYRPIKLNNWALMFEPNKSEGRTDRKANVVYNDTLNKILVSDVNRVLANENVVICNRGHNKDTLVFNRYSVEPFEIPWDERLIEIFPIVTSGTKTCKNQFIAAYSERESAFKIYEPIERSEFSIASHVIANYTPVILTLRILELRKNIYAIRCTFEHNAQGKNKGTDSRDFIIGTLDCSTDKVVLAGFKNGISEHI